MALANDVISYDFAIRQLDDGDKDEEGGGQRIPGTAVIPRDDNRCYGTPAGM